MLPPARELLPEVAAIARPLVTAECFESLCAVVTRTSLFAAYQSPEEMEPVQGHRRVIEAEIHS
jgi:hypothetical protein